MKKENKYKKITDLFFEMKRLALVRHEGWTMAQVSDPENVAEHTTHVGQIGIILAKMEGADVGKVAIMSLLHDLAEVRVGDKDRVKLKYVDYDMLEESESKAFQDQMGLLDATGDYFVELMKEFDARETLEAKCAKDADYLSQAVLARIYITRGYPGCQNWIDNIKKTLHTDSAKEIIKVIDKADPNEWWKDLKRLKEVYKKEE